MVKTLIDYFHVAPKGRTVSFNKINDIAMQVGYIVHPDCCTEDVLSYLNWIGVNPNSTFYKRWEEVTSKSRFELFFDQVRHYASTYGSDYQEEAYIPNDGNTDETYNFKEYTVIMPVTPLQLCIKCFAALKSGIALKKTTVEAMVDYIVEYELFDFNIDDIKNREAQILLCDRLNIAPSDKFSLLRYIIYKTIGETMIIQNDETIRRIKCSNNKFDLSILNNKQLVNLSSIFRRYKNILLPLKGYKDNTSIINKLNRMAYKHHEPIRESIWDNITSGAYGIEHIKNSLGSLTTFRKVSLIMAIKERLANDPSRVFIIRNQKVFVKKNKPEGFTEVLPGFGPDYLLEVIEVLENSIIEDIKDKACPVIFPENFELACPTSEKNFVGPYPFGTNYELQDNTTVGIYWKEAWGTRDFDLSFLNTKGIKVGWNGNYNNTGLVYSGDMTSANPEAAENILFTNKDIEGTVMINRFNGSQGSKYRFYFSDEKCVNMKKNHMVDPASIKLNADMVSDTTQETLGIIANGKFTFMRLGSGNGIVSTGRGASKQFEALKYKTEKFIPLKNVLLAAGFTEATDKDIEEGNVLDLSSPTKEDIISIFSKQ